MIYIAFIIFTILIILLAFYQWQYYMVFSPTYYREGSLANNCSLMSMQTEKGVTLEGAIYEPSDAKQTLLVFVGRSHDAVGIINRLASTYPTLRIISFNYRSYGKSEGKITEQNMFSDGVQIAELIQKNYGDFYLLGYSIGSSVAAYVASRVAVKSLFLIGAFDSIASLAKSKFVDKGFFPCIDLSSVFRYKFRTGVYVKHVNAETYLFVSRDDKTTYIENARELKGKIANLAEYVELEGLNHHEILWDTQVTQKINRVIDA